MNDDKIVNHVTVMRVLFLELTLLVALSIPITGASLGHAAVTCDVSRIVTGHVHFRKLHHVGYRVL